MGDYLIKRPMLICGIGCCIVSVISFYAKNILDFILFLLPAIILFLILKKADPRLIVASILIFVMCVSSNQELKHIRSLNGYSNLKGEGFFTVCDIDYIDEKFHIATIEVMDGGYMTPGTRIIAIYSPMKIEIGQKIKADIKVKPIDDDEYKGDNYSKEIYLKGSLKDITIIEDEYDTVLTGAERVKEYIKNTLSKHIGYEETATLCALIFGERDYFTKEFYGCVKAAGVSHVMVVSGMHMAILVSFFLKISEKIFYNRYVKAITILFVVAVLTVICGFTMSVLRAGITYIFMASGVLIDRRGTPENTLGAAMTVILISSPFAIFSISLQLSALSTFGILVVALPVTELLKSKGLLNKLTEPIVTSILFSLSAMLLTLPVIVYIFGYISVVSVISNLLISTAVTIAMSIAITGLIVNLIFPFATAPILFAAGLVTRYINAVIIALGSLPFAVVRIPQELTVFAIVLIFVVLMLLLACKKRNNMLKLKAVNEKIIKEGGGKFKWHP